MPSSEIRAVTFDAAHTLYHPHPSVGAIYREVMQRHGLDYGKEELQAGFARAFASVSKDKTILDGERREYSYWQAVVRESISQLRPQPGDFSTLFEDLWETFSHGHRWRPADKARETLSELRRRGYRTALLTNWDARVRRVVAETGFEPLFDALYISSEIGYEKPEAEIFAHAQRGLALGPAQILHVGDSLQHDMEGAREAGWQAIRIIDEERHQADYPSIRSLPELLDLLPPR
ncbi:HAD-IA family hydrolase [Pelagicoccus sp. SDUM812003]|uniref:HAD-IA family hydrolase n=1 Tax=Pelagicoccus sp. SDUM812003 TaxID=3041267 RepID=UPI0028100362|nr:HAD-IA family hydrolase [Pelagicoccus sp. SDUM812003]MDQ8204399.1 HAD-IA family hydrolase [Pelagicoccus sp. SDUM812003]